MTDRPTETRALSVCRDCVAFLSFGIADEDHAVRVEVLWPDAWQLSCDFEPDSYDEFSVRSCDCCGSTMAGERSPVTAFRFL
jgi:hypothetical protein